MEQKEKELLLKDLCARLPYGVKGETLGSKTCTLTHLGKEGDFTADDYHGWLNSGQFIPYLRPMSSMTEEEKDYVVKHSLGYTANIGGGKKDEKLYFHFKAESFDWLNKNMFDYRGLIPAGCAIEVTEENNPYVED